MEASTGDLLIGQVSAHLKTLPARLRVRESIYNHFLPHCDQFGISEDDFYKLILKPAFRDAGQAPDEDPDPPNKKGTFIKVFGQAIQSLPRLGAVLFEDPAREKVYFEDVTFLKAHVDTLEDGDVAIAYADLYKSESDPEKRYLKICYRLNPALPYRIGEEVFGTLEELLTAGFKSRLLMNNIYKAYETGKLHIWLWERYPGVFPVIPEKPTVVTFLTFVYSVNPHYPFFIDQELFSSPGELVTKAQRDLSFWEKLLIACNNGNLWVWLDAFGHPEWREQLRKATTKIQMDSSIAKEEKAYAIIQQLLYIIDPDTVRPMILAGDAQIELLSLPATELREVPVELRLKGPGFVKVAISLQPACGGIWLDSDSETFFDLTSQKQTVIKLSIDPQQLEKDAEYQTSIQLVTQHQTIIIPVRVKAVFPLRTFLLSIAKYSLLGGLFFGFFRWLLAAGTGRAEGLPPRIITSEIGRSLPDNYLTVYWVFLTMLGSFLLSIFIIKKVEKI